MIITRRGKDRFAVFKPVSEADKAVLEDLESVYRAVARPEWGKSPSALCSFDDNPASHEAFRERAADAVWKAFEYEVAREASDSGFRFRSSDVEACRAHMVTLYWAIRKANPVFDYPTRARALVKAREKAEERTPRWAWQLQPPVKTIRLLDSIEDGKDGAAA